MICILCMRASVQPLVCPTDFSKTTAFTTFGKLLVLMNFIQFECMASSVVQLLPLYLQGGM